MDYRKKYGPDYIDTKDHEWAFGNVSINLNNFISSPEHVSKIYSKYSSKAYATMFEGVMGLLMELTE